MISTSANEDIKKKKIQQLSFFQGVVKMVSRCKKLSFHREDLNAMLNLLVYHKLSEPVHP